MMRRFALTVEIARPHNMAAAALCVLGGYCVSGGRAIGDITAALVFTAVVSGLGFLINDYCDAEIDRVNKPGRPIPSGRLPHRFVLNVYVTGTIVATMLMCLLLPRPMLVLLLSWEAALYLYARSAKRMTLVGNVLVAAVAASAFLGGASLAGDYSRVVYPMVFAFLLVMGRELIKGGEDIDGDRSAGARTLAVRIGEAQTAAWAAIALCVCVIAAPVPALLGELSRPYGVVIDLGVVPGLLGATYIILKNPRRKSFKQASRILKIVMFAGIIAVSLGAP